MLLLVTGILKREMYDLFSLSKHAARRNQFRAAGREQARIAAARVAKASQPGTSDELAKARAEVTTPLALGDHAAAGAAYRRLLDQHGATTASALLSRKSQYDLANGLFAAGDHQTAATAYRLFMEGYPKDAELPTVRLMLGLINARYLNDPVKAKQEINEALPGLADGEHKELAKELLAELG
jgi:TolA-binding protein